MGGPTVNRPRSARATRILNLLLTILLLSSVLPPVPALPTEDVCDGDVSLGSIVPVGLARASDDDLLPSCVGPGNGSDPNPCGEAETPELTWSKPQAWSTISGSVPFAGGVTAPNDNVIVEVQVTTPEASTGWRTASHDPATDAWSWSFDSVGWTLDHGDGEVTAKVRANTSAGCFDRELPRTLTVGNRPTVTLEEPVEGDGVAGTLTISGTAWDRDVGVDRVRWRVDGGSWRTVSVDSTPGVEAEWSTTWDSSQLADGEHTLTVQAVDEYGVPSKTEKRSVHTRNDLPPPYRHPRSEPDADLNGLGDTFETAYNITDAAADPDGDGLPNLDEFRWDTIPVPRVEALGGAVRVFPNAQDYDADQWPDGPEAAYWEARLEDEDSLTTLAPDPAEDTVEDAKGTADAATDQALGTADAIYEPFRNILNGLGASTPRPSTLPTTAHGLTRPTVSQLDTDGDGVPNIHDRDSDDDGLQDGVEIALGTLPDVGDSDCHRRGDCPPSSSLSTPPSVTTWPADTVSPPVGPSITQPYAQAPKWTMQGVVGAWSLDPADAWRTWPHLHWDQSGHGHDLAPWKAPSTERANATWGNYSTLQPGSRLTYPGLLPIEPSRFTFAAHVRPSSSMGHGTVVSQNLGGGHCGPSFGLHVDGQGRPVLVYAYAPDDVVVLAGGPDLADLGSGWHHVAGTFDGSEATIWVDGEPRNTELVPQRTLPAPAPEACSGTFSVGRTAFKATATQDAPDSASAGRIKDVPPSYAWYWTGDADDIVVANDVLTETSIGALADAPFDPAPLVDEGGERDDATPRTTRTGNNDTDHPKVPNANPQNASQPGNPGDGFNDSSEYEYWENVHPTEDWNDDTDGDGVYNLLDWDSDADGCSDGEEVEIGTDPADGLDCEREHVEHLRNASREDPRNEDLEELHDVNRRYLENRTTDEEARADKVVQVDEEAAYEYTRDQVEAGLNVATRGTPLNEPVREVAREAFSLVDPGAVVGCVDDARAYVDEETRLDQEPPVTPEHVLGRFVLPNTTVPENRSEARDRFWELRQDAHDNATHTRWHVPSVEEETEHATCILRALGAPEVDALARDTVERVRGIHGSATTTVNETVTRVEQVEVDPEPVLHNVTSLVGNATNIATGTVNATRGNATVLVEDLNVTGSRSFLPELLRNLTVPVEHPLVGSDLYGAVLDLEEAAGVPLVEAVDSTHADLAVHNGTAWVLVENVPTGVPEGVDVDDDGEDELRVTVTNRDNTLPLHLVPGRTEHAPTLQMERLHDAPDVETVAAFLQHPDTPHVTALAVSPNGSLPDTASVGLRAAHIRDEAPAMDVAASTSDGPAPAFHASVIPVEITEDGKKVAKGRTVSMNLTAPTLEGEASATAMVENGTHSVAWSAHASGTARVRFLDVNGTDSYGVQAVVENGPASWSLTRDTAPYSVSWTGDSLGDATGGLVEDAAADAVMLDLRDTRATRDDNVTLDITGVQSAWSVTATPGSSISVSAREAPKSLHLVNDRGAGDCTAPDGDHASLVQHGDVDCLSVSLQDVESLGLAYDGAMPTFTFQGDNSIRDLRVLLVDGANTVQADLSEQPASVSWDGSRWSASESVGSVLVESQGNQAVHRLDITNAAPAMNLTRDATTPSFRFDASAPVDFVTLEVAPERSLPNVTGDHVALDADASALSTNDAWSVHLNDVREAEFQASSVEDATVHAHTTSPRTVQFDVDAPSTRLHTTLKGTKGATWWNATADHGFTLQGSVDHVTVDAAIGDQMAHLNLTHPARSLEVTATASNSGETLRVLGSGASDDLKWTRAPSANAPSVLPGSSTVTVHRAGPESDAVSVHANLQDVQNIEVTRTDANLTVGQAQARDLQAHLGTGENALTLTANGLPTRGEFTPAATEYRYTAPLGSTTPGFTLQGSVDHRPIHWNTTGAPGNVAVEWSTQPPRITMTHGGTNLAGLNLTAGTKAPDTPNLHIEATDIPRDMQVSVSDAWNRTEVTTQGTGEVGELTIHHGLTDRVEVPTSDLAGYVLAKQDPSTAGDDPTRAGGSIAVHVTDTKRVAATMASSTGTANVVADGSGTGAFLLEADPAGEDRLTARFTKPAGSMEATTGFRAPPVHEDGNDGDAASLQVHLTATGSATLAELHHATRHRSLLVHDATYQDEGHVTWTEGADLRVTSPHPATVGVRYGDSIQHSAPWTEGDHIALHEDRDVPRVGLHLTDVTAVHAPADTGFHIDSSSGAALRVERKLTSLHTRMYLTPLNGATTLNWTLTEAGINLTTTTSLTTAHVDTVKGSSQLAVRLQGVPAGKTSLGANRTRVHVTPPTGDSLERAFLAHRGDAPTRDLQPVDLLGPREGVVWATNPLREGGAAAPTREGLTMNISNVKSLELVRSTGSMEVEAERTSLASSVSARFVSISDETTVDVTLDTLGSSLDTSLQHNGTVKLTHDTTRSGVNQVFKLKAPQGFLEVTAEDSGDIHTLIKRPSQQGRLTADGADVTLQATGAFGATDLHVQDHPSSPLTWTVSESTGQGTLGFGSGSATHLQAHIAPSNSTEHRAMHAWSCPRDTCVFVDTTRHPAVVQIESSYLESASWSLAKLGQPRVDLDRGAYAAGAGNLTLHDGEQTLYLRSDALAEDVRLEASDPLATPQAPSGFSASTSQAPPRSPAGAQTTTGSTGTPTTSVTYTANEATDVESGYRHDGRFITVDAQEAPSEWSVTESGDQTTNSYEMTWDGNTDSDQLEVRSNVHPQGSTELSAADAPSDWTARIEPGDCGLTEPFQTALTPTGGDFHEVNWTATQDGTIPGSNDGLDIRCEDGEGIVQAILDQVVDLEVYQAPCVGYANITATRESTPYAVYTSAGMMLGRIRLDSGVGQLHAEVNNQGGTGQYGYSVENVANAGEIAYWSLAFNRTLPAEAKTCPVVVKDRPAKWVQFMGEGLPMWLTAEVKDPSTTVKAEMGNRIDEFDGRVKLGAPVEDSTGEGKAAGASSSSGEAGDGPLKIQVHPSIGDLDVRISDGPLNRTLDTNADTKLVHIEQDGELYARAKVTGMDEFLARLFTNDTKTNVRMVYDGAPVSFDYYSDTENTERRVRFEDLPSRLDFNVTSRDKNVAGWIKNKGGINLLKYWEKTKKSDESKSKMRFAKMNGVPDTDFIKWNIKYDLSGPAGEVRLKPAGGGTISKITMGEAVSKEEHKYSNITLNNARIHYQYDFDGDKGTPENPRYVFLDTDGETVTGGPFHVEWGSLGFRFKHGANLGFKSEGFQFKWGFWGGLTAPLGSFGGSVAIPFPYIGINGWVVPTSVDDFHTHVKISDWYKVSPCEVSPTLCQAP